jgi:hypothetical protein
MASCNWILAPSGATQVDITFKDFSTENTFDVVQVYECTDKTCNYKKLLTKLTGTYTSDQKVTSRSGFVSVWFISDDSVAGPGFNAFWSSSAPVPPVSTIKSCSRKHNLPLIEGFTCRGALLTAITLWLWQAPSYLCTGCNFCGSLTSSSGTFSDESGASNYSNSANCMWTINPPGADYINITFSEFSTERGYDFVRVYECTDYNCRSAQLLAELTGTYSSSRSFTSATSFMAVWFSSDASVTSSGFHVSWTALVPPLPVSMLWPLIVFLS